MSHVIWLHHSQERHRNGIKIGDGDEMTKYRNLVAFDFDHTVVDGNTDIVVRDLIAKDKIPEEVKFLYTSSGWIPYMHAIFRLLHENGIRRTDMLTAIEKIPEVTGMKKLIRRLHGTRDTDVLIVSDSNSKFIDHWCRHNDVVDCVKKVFTNPAEFDANEVLNIQPFHHQTTCSLSSVNLCKGAILEDYLQQQEETNGVTYKKIFYVGDGHNDFCPVLRLARGDVGCARKGHRLERELQEFVNEKTVTVDEIDSPKNKSVNTVGFTLDADAFVWKDGNELAEFIFKMI